MTTNFFKLGHNIININAIVRVELVDKDNMTFHFTSKTVFHLKREDDPEQYEQLERMFELI